MKKRQKYQRWEWTNRQNLLKPQHQWQTKLLEPSNNSTIFKPNITFSSISILFQPICSISVFVGNNPSQATGDWVPHRSKDSYYLSESSNSLVNFAKGNSFKDLLCHAGRNSWLNLLTWQKWLNELKTPR